MSDYFDRVRADMKRWDREQLETQYMNAVEATWALNKAIADQRKPPDAQTAELTALREQVAELREALEKIAELDRCCDADGLDKALTDCGRYARAALAKGGGE